MRAEIDGTLYAVGGYNGTLNGDLATVEAYNPVTNTWRSVAPLPRLDSGTNGRYGATIGVINGQLYVAGGWRRVPALPTNTLLVYDPKTDTWATRTPMPILSGRRRR